MKNFWKPASVIMILWTISVTTFAAFNETFTINNSTNKYLVVQETFNRQITTTLKKYIIYPNSTNTWTVTVNPSKNFNEWYYEFKISGALTSSGANSELICIVNEDVEGLATPRASHLMYNVNIDSYQRNFDGSVITILSVTN